MATSVTNFDRSSSSTQGGSGSNFTTPGFIANPTLTGGDTAGTVAGTYTSNKGGVRLFSVEFGTAKGAAPVVALQASSALVVWPENVTTTGFDVYVSGVNQGTFGGALSISYITAAAE